LNYREAGYQEEDLVKVELALNGTITSSPTMTTIVIHHHPPHYHKITTPFFLLSLRGTHKPRILQISPHAATTSTTTTAIAAPTATSPPLPFYPQVRRWMLCHS